MAKKIYQDDIDNYHTKYKRHIIIYFIFNGIVHPKMKMHSLSTNHYPDGGGGWSAWVHKTLLECQG